MSTINTKAAAAPPKMYNGFGDCQKSPRLPLREDRFIAVTLVGPCVLLKSDGGVFSRNLSRFGKRNSGVRSAFRPGEKARPPIVVTAIREMRHPVAEIGQNFAFELFQFRLVRVSHE